MSRANRKSLEINQTASSDLPIRSGGLVEAVNRHVVAPPPTSKVVPANGEESASKSTAEAEGT